MKRLLMRAEVLASVAAVEARLRGLTVDTDPSTVREMTDWCARELNTLRLRQWSVAPCLQCGKEHWGHLRPYCNQGCADAAARERRQEERLANGGDK